MLVRMKQLRSTLPSVVALAGAEGAPAGPGPQRAESSRRESTLESLDD